MRFDRLTPSNLNEDQQTLYRGITQGPRAEGVQLFELTDEDGGLRGPFNAFLLSPALGKVLAELGAAIRFNSTLTPRVREMAVLAVAARWNSEFEFYAHERIGRSVGLSEEEIELLRAGGIPDGINASEGSALIAVGYLLDGDLPDEIYEEIVARLGAAALFELSTLIGYYATLALQMRVFRVTD
jgi:4-carboxymuconolactone decarboxylase